MYKNNRFPRISESFNVQFRVEMFNVLNRRNMAFPNSTIFDQTGAAVATAGSITSAATTNRQIQLALKLMF